MKNIRNHSGWIHLFGVLWFSVSFAQAGTPPADAEWIANATLKQPRILTITNVGACQGVSLYDGKIYLYGDVHDAKPRVGVIREYDINMKPTGRHVWLKQNGKPIIRHPTGLTWHKKWGCFLGNTVDGKATIYQLDWKQAWKDGNLDNAVRTVIIDDAAVNGCRPLFVTVAGKSYLATADYGDKSHLRLYDPGALIKAKRSRAPGVKVYDLPFGSFNQNLDWDDKSGQIIGVQNVVAGRGFRLDYIHLAKAIKAGNASAKGVRNKTITYPPHTELEGYRELRSGVGIFVTAHPKDNVIIGETIKISPRKSPKGFAGWNPKK